MSLMASCAAEKNKKTESCLFIWIWSRETGRNYNLLYPEKNYEHIHLNTSFDKL